MKALWARHFRWMSCTGDGIIMTRETAPEQDVRHKSHASGQLTQALLSLWAAERLCEKCAANKDGLSALIRDAIVLYGSAFKGRTVADGVARTLSQEAYIPKHFEGLHRDLIAYGDGLFAHFDTETGPSCHRVAKGPLDFQDEIPTIKALILEIVSDKLWPEILDEHQDLLPQK